jgi:hypothetical protein
MKSFFFSLCFLLSCFFSEAKEKNPPGPVVFSLNAATLKTNQKRIDSKDPSLMPAYKELLKDADKALTQGPFSVMEKKNNPPSGDKHDYMSLAPYHWPDPSKPNGLPYMRKDGQTNPEVKEYLDKDYMPRLCDLVQTLGLAYFFSGDERYAYHAATLLKVWFLNPETKMNPNLNYAQAIKGENEGRGAGIIDSRHFIKLVDGIGLLEGSKSWKSEDQKGHAAMVYQLSRLDANQQERRIRTECGKQSRHLVRCFAVVTFPVHQQYRGGKKNCCQCVGSS